MTDDHRLAEAMERAVAWGFSKRLAQVDTEGQSGNQLLARVMQNVLIEAFNDRQVLAARVRELKTELDAVKAERDRLWDEIEGEEREAG